MWRLIVDLFSPAGASVNDGIEPDMCSFLYMRLVSVIQQVNKIGIGNNGSKNGHRECLPNHPSAPRRQTPTRSALEGRVLLRPVCTLWFEVWPKIFTAVADPLQWIFQQYGMSWVDHYVDNFITAVTPGTQECKANEEMLESCRQLGVPVLPDKCTDPALVMVFLEFEPDMNNMVVRLPEEICTEFCYTYGSGREGKRVRGES